MQSGAANDACLLQAPEGTSVLAIYTSSKNVIFFTCDGNGGILRRRETLTDVVCIASLDMSGSTHTKEGEAL